MWSSLSVDSSCFTVVGPSTTKSSIAATVFTFHIACQSLPCSGPLLNQSAFVLCTSKEWFEKPTPQANSYVNRCNHITIKQALGTSSIAFSCCWGVASCMLYKCLPDDVSTFLRLEFKKNKVTMWPMWKIKWLLCWKWCSPSCDRSPIFSLPIQLSSLTPAFSAVLSICDWCKIN